MRKVGYVVNTKNGEMVEVKTLAEAREVVAKKGVTCKVNLMQISEIPSQISEKKREFLKSGAKPPKVSYSTLNGGR